MHKVSLALAIVGTSLSLLAQNCNTAPPASTLQSFSPWQASFYYGNLAENTLNQFLTLTVQTPLTINQMRSTTYDQGTGNPVVPDQQGNVAEVRLYTFPTTHTGNEGSMTGWTHIASGEMTMVAWNGDCPIVNFKDPVTNTPFTLVLPVGTYGFCVEYIPTSWTGTAALPQTNNPILNPGSIHCIGFDPQGNNQPYPAILGQDQFLTIDEGAIGQNGWQTVDMTGALIPNAAITGSLTDQPNLAFDYTPDAGAAIATAFGAGCYDAPFMIHEVLPAAVATIADVANTAYIATMIATTSSGKYQISSGGIPYIAPPAGATNLSMGGTAPAPTVASGGWDDGTVEYVPSTAFNVPTAAGLFQPSFVGINTNGKLYFESVALTNNSFSYNGSNYGSIAPFRDLAAQWSPWNTDLDPSSAGAGDVYVMEPSPNLGGLMVWWEGVGNWPYIAGQESSFSIEISPGGNLVNIAYGAAIYNDGSGDALIGYSAGGGEPVGGLIDWSAIPASPAYAQSGDGSAPPTLALLQRPVAGSVMTLSLGNLPTAAFPGVVPRLGVFSFNTAFSMPGIDLGTYGLAGCSFFLGLAPAPINVLPLEDLAGSPDEIRYDWSVPTGFNGVQIFVQGGVFHQVFPPNAAGITVTEAFCMKLGT